MTRQCPTAEDFVLLLDGELTENRASTVRAHVELCASCRRELAALQGLLEDVVEPIAPQPGALDRVIARLDEAPPGRGGFRSRTLRVWAAAATLAAVAAIALIPGLARRRSSADAMIPRGGSSGSSLERDVGIIVYRDDGSQRAIAADEAMGSETAYSVGYRNLGPAGSAFVMVFAQDAAGDVHWIEPAWLDPALDPASVPLAHADHLVLPSIATVLDRPAPGPMHVFSVVTANPLRATDVERLAARALAADSLRALWPRAIVDETVVRVVEPAEGAGR